MADNDTNDADEPMDALLSALAPSIPLQNAAGGACDRWRKQADRERVLWDLVDGALSEADEQAEWDHVAGCRACQAAVRRIQAGIEEAATQPRWGRDRIMELIARSAPAEPSPTEQTLGVLRDLVVRIVEGGLSLIEGTGDLAPAAVRVRDASEPEAEAVVVVGWDRPWGRLAAEVERVSADTCTLTFAVEARTEPAVGGALRIDWCDEQGRVLESAHVEGGRAQIADATPGRYIVTIAAGEKEIDRLTFGLE